MTKRAKPSIKLFNCPATDGANTKAKERSLERDTQSDVLSRLDRLQALLEAMEAGVSRPTDNEFMAYLPAAERRNYTEEVKTLRPKVPPWAKQALRKYLERIAAADSLFNRAESLNCSRHRTAHRNSHRRAEIGYDSALESLEECLGDYPDLCQWLDRPVAFYGEGCNVGADPEGVPRLLDSHSPYNLTLNRRRELQIHLLRCIVNDMADAI